MSINSRELFAPRGIRSSRRVPSAPRLLSPQGRTWIRGTTICKPARNVLGQNRLDDRTSWLSCGLLPWAIFGSTARSPLAPSFAMRGFPSVVRVFLSGTRSSPPGLGARATAHPGAVFICVLCWPSRLGFWPYVLFVSAIVSEMKSAVGIPAAFCDRGEYLAARACAASCSPRDLVSARALACVCVLLLFLRRAHH